MALQTAANPTISIRVVLNMLYRFMLQKQYAGAIAEMAGREAFSVVAATWNTGT